MRDARGRWIRPSNRSWPEYTRYEARQERAERRRGRRRRYGPIQWREAREDKTCPVCGEAYVESRAFESETFYDHDPASPGLRDTCRQEVDGE